MGNNALEREIADAIVGLEAVSDGGKEFSDAIKILHRAADERCTPLRLTIPQIKATLAAIGYVFAGPWPLGDTDSRVLSRAQKKLIDHALVEQTKG